MKAGDRVRLTISASPRLGTVLLCSPNEDSLIVELDEGLSTPSGVYVNMVPLLRADGIYRLGGHPVEVEIATQ